MKIEFLMDKIIIYLYQYELNFDNLNEEIKNILIKLINKYQIDFFGYSKVTIYNNHHYGNILEIEKIYDNKELSTINLRIIVYKDTLMYLEFDNLYFNKMPKGLINKNNKYYLNINDIENIMEYIEYGQINYKNNS